MNYEEEGSQIWKHGVPLLAITSKNWIFLVYEQYNIATSEPDNIYSPSLFDRNTHRFAAQILAQLGELNIQSCIY